MSFLYFTAIFLFIVACILLCSVILVQEGKGGGLGASFGGDSGESLFGASTADVLKRFTGWLATIFLASCVVLSLWTEIMDRGQAPANAYELPSVEESGS